MAGTVVQILHPQGDRSAVGAVIAYLDDAQQAATASPTAGAPRRRLRPPLRQYRRSADATRSARLTRSRLRLLLHHQRLPPVRATRPGASESPSDATCRSTASCRACKERRFGAYAER